MLTMPTHRLVRSFVAASLLASPAAAQTPAGWNDFKKLFQSYVDSDKVVGASVVAHQEPARRRAASTPVLRTAPPTCASTRRRSTTGARSPRALTAISIMQLRDRGKLSLDDKIVRWVPELRAMHDPYGMMDSITIRMLLSHTAGFQNPTWPYGNDQPWEPFEPTTWNQLVAMMPYQELRLQTRLALQLLESRVHLPRARDRADHRRPVGRVRPEEHLRAARAATAATSAARRTFSPSIGRTTTTCGSDSATRAVSS